MRKFVMLISAAAMATVMPSLADAQGRGKGQSARSAQTAKGAPRPARVRTDVRARTDARANARARARTGAAVDRRVDSDGDGVPDHRDRNVARRDSRWVLENGRWVRVSDHGRTAHPHGCPPGLANRNPPCVPPGQARRMFRQGQVVPASYRDYVGYQDLLNRLPPDLRDDVPVGDYRYIYRDDQVYVVDARTRLITSIIDILR